jgi:hypothetical protein
MKTIFYWLPRLLCIAAILFISLFALDSFSSELSLIQQLKDLMFHLAPSFILTLILLIAWKWELIGGIIFIVLGAVLIPYIFNLNYQRNHFSAMNSIGVIAIINLPFIIVGALFIYNHYRHKRTS